MNPKSKRRACFDYLVGMAWTHRICSSQNPSNRAARFRFVETRALVPCESEMKGNAILCPVLGAKQP